MPQPKPRILLKLSGEAFSAPNALGFCAKEMASIADDIHAAHPQITLAIVMGGGNLIRGNMLKNTGVTSVTADQMGMLATIQNALALQDLLCARNLPVYTASALGIPGVIPAFDHRKALRKLDQGTIVIAAGGTGNPFFTTDSTASLRAIMLQMNLILKATQVDGIYDKDPRKHPDAKRFETLSFQEALNLQLEVMDQNAFIQCRDHQIPIRVFDMSPPHALRQALQGAPLGTLCC